MPVPAQFRRGSLKIGEVVNVIAVEDAGRQMAAQLHGRVFREARSHHVPNGGAAEVVTGPAREASPLQAALQAS